MIALVVAADAGGRYVAAAYVVFASLIVAYIAIMAARLARIERDLDALEDRRRESER